MIRRQPRSLQTSANTRELGYSGSTCNRGEGEFIPIPMPHRQGDQGRTVSINVGHLRQQLPEPPNVGMTWGSSGGSS